MSSFPIGTAKIRLKVSIQLSFFSMNYQTSGSRRPEQTAFHAKIKTSFPDRPTKVHKVQEVQDYWEL